jgi:archaellum component FlaG (FlaF/FlaG flagellin family)
MDKVMVTILLVIAGVVCSMVVVNAMFPLINRSSGAIIDTVGKIDDRIKSNIEIIEVADESSDVHVWVKNIGASKITAIDQSDIFFGPDGNFERIPYGSAGSSEPYWDYTLENDTKWMPTATVKITIHLESPPSGVYFLKVVIHNGISDEYIFGM